LSISVSFKVFLLEYFVSSACHAFKRAKTNAEAKLIIS
jgi:hypothetical protein